MAEATLSMAPWAPEVRMWRRSWGGGTFLPVGWPLAALFVGLFVWWLLGLTMFVAPILAVPLALSLAGKDLRVPRGFGIWLLFLLWAVVSATQLTDIRAAAAWGYREFGYLAATVIFIYVLNAPSELLPTRRVVHILAAFWAMVVIGGIVGIVFPRVSLTTLAEALLPAPLLADTFVYDMVHASTSSERAFAAYPIYRPKAPFPYTNMWGATYAVSVPFAIAALRTVRRRSWRSLLVVLLFVSIAPLVFSLGRGAWLSVGVAALYAVFRLAGGRRARILLGLVLGLMVVGGLLAFTPLGEIIMVRLGAGYSDKDRILLYETSVDLARASPIFGHGTPVDVPGLPSAGTHGQFWTLLVSHGVPGLALFMGWLVLAWWRSGRRLWSARKRDPGIRFWAHLAIFIAMIQMPFYPLLPWSMPVIMVAAALVWREAMVEIPDAPPPLARRRAHARVPVGARP